jgi:geranylgeranyl diphosphate synthase, type I
VATPNQAAPGGAFSDATDGLAMQDPVDTENVRALTERALDDFLTVQEARLDGIGDELRPMMEAARRMLGAGKRLRPAFCYWGWRGAGAPTGSGIIHAAAALELLQASAIIHDDLMDGSDTRRGQPSAHRGFEQLHRSQEWLGSAESFGMGAAILLGDLCLVWADELFMASGLDAPAVLRAKPMYDEMRTELMCGQYMDLLEQAKGNGTLERLRQVLVYKSAKYTVERPLHLGAALAGAPAEAFRTYSAYGLTLGEAFQLRDDVLGVFGDPAQTGKPAGDDIREGKRTVLLATASGYATPGDQQILDRYLGDPGLDSGGIAQVRDVIVRTGALAEVERRIEELTALARTALQDGAVPEPARTVLDRLAVASTTRRT